jgi:endonuclease/exonuclease/phosphatase (EEP) superfamily protein YafD
MGFSVTALLIIIIGASVIFVLQMLQITKYGWDCISRKFALCAVAMFAIVPMLLSALAFLINADMDSFVGIMVICLSGLLLVVIIAAQEDAMTRLSPDETMTCREVLEKALKKHRV